MNKALLAKNAFISSIFICAAAALCLFPRGASAAFETQQPQIFNASGVVEIRQKDSSAWERVKKGDLVPPGASIATEPDADAILSIAGGIIHIFGETELIIEQLSPAKAGANAGANIGANIGETSGANNKTSAGQKTSTAITLRAGQIYLSVAQLTGASATFAVTTPSAVASVRNNAEFLVKLYDNGNTAIAVTSGHIAADSQGIEIILDPGYQTTIEPGMPPAEIHAILPMDVTALEAESRAANAIAVSSAQSAAPQPAPSPAATTETAKPATTSAPQLSSSTDRTSFQLVKTSNITPASTTTQTSPATASSANIATTSTAATTQASTPTRSIESLITEAEKTAPKQNRPQKTQSKPAENTNPAPDSGKTGKTNSDSNKNNEIKSEKNTEAATPADKSAKKTTEQTSEKNAPPSTKSSPAGQNSSKTGNQTPPPHAEKTKTDEDTLHDEISDHLNELLNER